MLNLLTTFILSSTCTSCPISPSTSLLFVDDEDNDEDEDEDEEEEEIFLLLLL